MAAISLASKIIAPLILLFGICGFGIMPVLFRDALLSFTCGIRICRKSWRVSCKDLTSFFTYLGGGMILATVLVHLLPEAREGFEEHERRKRSLPNITDQPDFNVTQHGADDHEKFPLPEFVMGCSFFLFYLMEELMMGLSKIGSHTHREYMETLHTLFEIRLLLAILENLQRSRSGSSQSLPQLATCSKDDGFPNGSRRNSSNSLPPSMKLFPEEDERVIDNGHPQPPMNHHQEKSTGTVMVGLAKLTYLLCFSMVEGITVAIQDTERQFWILFFPVSVHIVTLFFVDQLESPTKGSPLWGFFSKLPMFAFTPVIMLVAGFIDVLNKDPLMYGFGNAVTAGYLQYIIFCEIFRSEEEHKSLKEWQQFLATIFGFGFICFLHYIIPFKSGVPRIKS